MRVLDLFSGIGGFSLGLERAGMKTVAFCENDPFCRAVLAKHWPEVPCYGDIRILRLPRGSADLVCGGFPCQPFSHASAGRRRGKEDDRYLWPEMLRVLAEVRPRWVCCENVAGIDGLALEQVVSDLEGAAYTVAPILEIPACSVGLDHWRPRYWFLGYSNDQSQSGQPVDAEVAELSWVRSDTGSPRAENGFPRGVDGHRRRVLGNAVVPEIAELIGRAIMECENHGE
jgi:DNA (cytosine-5)-methyltransferase 1